MNLADILKDIGNEGLFQIIALLILTMPKMPLQWSMTMMSYAAFEPEWCCIPENVLQVSSCEGRYLDADHNVTNRTFTEQLKNCDLNSSMCGTKVYLASDGASTAVTEWDLVCDQQWVVSALSSIQMGGVMVGALVSGSLSDIFGRKKVNFAALLAQAVFNLAAGFSNSWVMFAVFRFFIGVSGGAYIVVHMPYILEFVSSRWRVVPASIPFSSIGASLLPIAAWQLPDWRWMHFICAIFTAPFLLGYFILPESLRWLTIKGKIDEAVKVMNKIATINKKVYNPEKCLKKIQKIADRERHVLQKGRMYSYLDVYRGWKMARLTLTLQFVWFTTSLVGYGIILGISDLAGNIYLNMFVMEVVVIPFVVVTYYFSNRIGRRYTALVYFGLSTVTALLAFIFHLVPTMPNRDTLITVMCISCHTFIAGASAVFVVISTEVYPTVIRTLGYGAANTAAKVGGVIAPFLINMDKIPTVSYAVIFATCLLCVAAVLSLSETKNLTMEDTLEKAGSKLSLMSSLSASIEKKPTSRRSSSQPRIIIDIDTDLIHHQSYSEFDDDRDDETDKVELVKSENVEQSPLKLQRHPMYDPDFSSAAIQDSKNGSLDKRHGYIHTSEIHIFTDNKGITNRTFLEDVEGIHVDPIEQVHQRQSDSGNFRTLVVKSVDIDAHREAGGSRVYGSGRLVSGHSEGRVESVNGRVRNKDGKFVNEY